MYGHNTSIVASVPALQLLGMIYDFHFDIYLFYTYNLWVGTSFKSYEQVFKTRWE